jgi:outer membrane protein assembly factor BamE (lipoprotein component of BamABCDE complex)
MMFTTKNFEALTEGLSSMEIEAIKKGVLVNGMSKRAVLICYGPPPEHYTPNQNANTWYYWANRKDKIEIKFDHHGKLVIGDRSSQVDNKTERQSETMASKSQSSSASETQVAAIPKIKVIKKNHGLEYGK